MKYCPKCERNTPTKKNKESEECMVCGEILTNLKSTEKQKSVPKIQKEQKSPQAKTKSKDIADEYYGRYSESTGNSAKILGGIMIMIVGFSVLTLGNFLISTILEGFRTVPNSIYNTNLTPESDIASYVSSVFPLLGLALMFSGFSVILFMIRKSTDLEGREHW